MSGERDSNMVELGVQPGVYTNASDRAGKNRWKDANWVRWHKGYAEKMGGYVRQALTGFNAGVYLGVCRALNDWSAIDSQQFIGIGTHLKLFLANNNALYDITPLRKSSNVTNPFTTINGSPNVTVVDVDARANVGDYITISDAVAVGGLTLNGFYAVATVISADSYTIVASANATSGATGGGSCTIAYDIYPGLASNGELLGYGTSTYGGGTYGTPRGVGTGVPAKLRTWSLANWGEDLIASPTKGGIYWWDRSTGPNSRATLLLNAPTDVTRVLLNADSGYVIALGCSDLAGTGFDPMLIRWCVQGDFQTWFPDTTQGNAAAGFYRLGVGSRIVTGLHTRGQNMVWTDTQLYSMQFNGAGFSFDAKGACAIIGPNAAADVNGLIMFWGYDDFFLYDGTLRVLPCDVWTYVMNDFDRTQAEKVYCSRYTTKNEVTWFYPSNSGGTHENDRYVTYNYELNCWYYGSIVRTAYHDVSPAIGGSYTNPYAANGGYLWLHESGLDQVVAGVTTPLNWFLESWDVSLGGTDKLYLVNSIVPDFDRKAGEFNWTIKAKTKPLDPYIVKGPYRQTPTMTKIDVRARGAQIAIRLEPYAPSAASSDPYFNNVVLLMHMDGGAGSTTFVDSSAYAHVFSVTGGSPPSQVITPAPKFGVSAASSSTGGVDLATPTASEFNPGTADFTIEAWVYVPSPWVPANGAINIFKLGSGTDFSGTVPIYLHVNNNAGGAEPRCYFRVAGVQYDSYSAPHLTMSLDAWHYIAFCRSGTTFTLFVDGAVASTITAVGALDTALTKIHVAADESTSVKQLGYVDELRYTVGVARYTGAFTPPTAAGAGVQAGPAAGNDFRLGVLQTSPIPYGAR